MRKQIKVSQQLFELAKKQFAEGKISKENYQSTLELILEKINDPEISLTKKSALWEQININIDLDIRGTINHVFALN